MGRAPKKESFAAAGLQADDLDAALRAITRFDRESAKEIKRSIREHAKPIQQLARQNVARSQGTHKKVRGVVIGISITNKGAALALKPSVSPLAWSLEFGMKAGGMVPRRTGRGKGRITRYSRPFKGEGESFLKYRGYYGNKILQGDKGFVMGRAVRQGMPRFERELMDDLDDLMDEVMSKAGVPRKGSA